MKKQFDIFHNNRAEVFESEGISEYSSTAGMTLLNVISADIQPVSGEVSDEEFSLAEKRRVRMFYGRENSIKVGNYVRIDKIMYRAEYVEKRILGNMAVLCEVI